jgi:hypothetical protein
MRASVLEGDEQVGVVLVEEAAVAAMDRGMKGYPSARPSPATRSGADAPV